MQLASKVKRVEQNNNKDIDTHFLHSLNKYCVSFTVLSCSFKYNFSVRCLCSERWETGSKYGNSRFTCLFSPRNH